MPVSNPRGDSLPHGLHLTEHLLNFCAIPSIPSALAKERARAKPGRDDLRNGTQMGSSVLGMEHERHSRSISCDITD